MLTAVGMGPCAGWGVGAGLMVMVRVLLVWMLAYPAVWSFMLMGIVRVPGGVSGGGLMVAGMVAVLMGWVLVSWMGMGGVVSQSAVMDWTVSVGVPVQVRVRLTSAWPPWTASALAVASLTLMRVSPPPPAALVA